MLQTLGTRWAARYHNMMQRYSDLIEIAIRSNLADSFGSGVLVLVRGGCSSRPRFMPRECTLAPRELRVKVEAASDLPWHLQEPDVSAPFRRQQDFEDLRGELDHAGAAGAFRPQRI
jgi:hypothetical protein